MGDWMIGVIAVFGVLTSVCLLGVVLALAQELERAEAALTARRMRAMIEEYTND